MTDVFGDNTLAMDASAGLITELAFPEPLDAPCVPTTGARGDMGEMDTAVATLSQAGDMVMPAARLKLGGALLGKDDDLLGSWSVDGNCLNVVTMPGLDEGTHRRRAIEFDGDGVMIVGADASVVDGGRRVLLGIVTSDGYVHATTLPVEVGDDLHASNESQMSSVDFVEDRARGRTPATETYSANSIRGVAVVGTTICIGKDIGVLCFSMTESATISNNECFVLGAQTGILGNVASYLGFFGGSLLAGPSAPLACMSSVTVGARHLLFALHEDSTLNVWDVASRALLYSVGSLPEAQREAFTPSCLGWSRDLVNAAGVFLIASFEDTETSTTTIVALFEVTVDDRGPGAVNVHVENGPQLPDVRGRVTSASLEFVAASGYRLWLVMEDASNSVECISFKGDSRGNHTSASYKVETMDARLHDLLPASDVEQEILKMYFVELERIMSESGCESCTGSMRGYAVHTARLPWNSSRRAFLDSGRAVGLLDNTEGASDRCLTEGYITEASLARMVQRIQDWIDGSASSVEAFERSMAFLKVYIGGFVKTSKPRSIQVIQRNLSSPDRLIVLVRGNGVISALADASAEESLRYVDPACRSLAALSSPCMGPAAMSMSRYAMCRGVSMKGSLLPAIVDVVAGKCHLNAVEFGRHHSDVRRAFRAFSVSMASLNAGNDEKIAGIAGKIFELGSTPKEASPWAVRSLDPERGAPGARGHHSDIRGCLAKVALEGCTRTLLDVSLQLLIVASGLRDGGLIDSLASSLKPSVLSHWACTTTAVTDAGDKSEPMNIEDSAKKRKRMVQDGRQHVFDLALKCCDELTGRLSEQRGTILGMDRLRVAVIHQFLSRSNGMRPIMHAIMRSKCISNKLELLDSLLSVIEDGEDASFKFFKAYNLSRKTRSASGNDIMERSRLDQEGLGLFLSLCDILERDELAECISSVTGKETIPELTPEGYIDAVAEIVDHLGCLSSSVRAGLFSAKIQEASGATEAAARARTRVFKTLEENRHMQEAYTIALSVSDPQRQLDCLRSLVACVCSSRMVDVLCSLPLVALQDASGINVLEIVTHALWDRASKEPIDQTTTYSTLYDFFVSRGNYQSAARALLMYARRIANESERNGLEKLLALQNILTMTVGCLKLVRESDAWLEDGTIDCDIKVRKTESFQMEYSVPSTVTVRDVEKELLLAKSLLKVVSLNPEFDIQLASHHDILVELLEHGLYDSSWDLASILPFNEIQSSKELIVFKLGKDAFATGAGGDVEASRELWTKLQSLVDDEPLGVADRLRLAVAEGILEMDSATGLPSWLMEPYLSKFAPFSSQSEPDTQRADAAGMIRILLHYGRRHQAGILALEMLDPLVTSLPSVAFPRVGAVSIPHDLIDAVVSSLRSTPGDAANSLASRLESTVRRCIASSRGQLTNVLGGKSM
jgi:hypothetical protein